MNLAPTPLRFYAFWAINGALDRRRLFRQLEDFVRAGFDGVVFHPRFYPESPPYLSPPYLQILGETIVQAKALGLRFWLYDENGWPSGTANGRLYSQFPDDVCQRLDLLEESCGTTLGSFEDEGRTWHLGVRNVRGIDCFNPAAARHFLATTHEVYRTGLSPEAFAHVEAFFTDEPESGLSWEPMPRHAAIPWSRHMTTFLRERFGQDMTAQLPLLFRAGEGAQEFRRGYWELITDLFCRGYLDPCREWCERHGKLFVGHVKGEEHPLFQIPMVGSCQRAYRHFGIPGIDALERDPGNHFFPRQASSVARQFGNGRCMVEANGGAGWGTSPEDLQRYLLWLGHQGLTDFVLHLSQYQLDSAALHDWPPSQPFHLSWRDAYPELLARVRHEIEEARSAPRELLVIAPYRALMENYEPWELLKTNIHNGADFPLTVAGQINARFLKTIETLHACGTGYDITDERTLEEEGRLERGALLLGQASYQSLLVPEEASLTPAGRTLISRARTIGIRIVHEAPPLPAVDLSGKINEPAHLDLKWTSVETLGNAFLLETVSSEDGLFTARFSTPQLLPADANLSLVFVDPIVDVFLNGQSLSAATEDNVTRTNVLSKMLATTNELTFRSGIRFIRPYVWLEGAFLVKSRSSYQAAPNRTLSTNGPWEILRAADLPSFEFVQSGLPFAFHPVQAIAEIEIPSGTGELAFEYSSAPPDALRLWLNEKELGWVWGPDWAIRLPAVTREGRNRLRVLCYPSSYNYYGPHHYYRGDTHVVSPDQIKGVRNFADPPDAPQETHVAAFHFRPWSLPRRIVFGSS